MRVLQIGATYVGAQKKIESAIHSFLIGSGHESYILYAYGNSKDANIIKYESKLALYVRRGVWSKVVKSPHAALLSTIELLRRIENISPDIVHIHIIHHGYIDYPLLFNYLAKKRIPVVYTLHDMWIFTGGCYYYSEELCNAFVYGCKKCLKCKSELDCNPKKTEYYHALKNVLLANLHRVAFVAVSDWVKSEAEKTELQKYPIYTIWNSLDSGLYRNICVTNQRGQVRSKKFRIIGVANSWSHRKGISRFFELATMLDNDYEIILVGGISNLLKNGAPKNVLFVGAVDSESHLAELYSSADIHISMSMEETFGFTFVEAAFAGIKSIGFDCTAIAQVVQKVNGFIVRAGDINEMAKQVRLLSSNRNLCKLSDLEREQVFEEFSPLKMSMGYCKVYSQLLL